MASHSATMPLRGSSSSSTGTDRTRTNNSDGGSSGSLGASPGKRSTGTPVSEGYPTLDSSTLPLRPAEPPRPSVKSAPPPPPPPPNSALYLARYGLTRQPSPSSSIGQGSESGTGAGTSPGGGIGGTRTLPTRYPPCPPIPAPKPSIEITMDASSPSPVSGGSGSRHHPQQHQQQQQQQYASRHSHRKDSPGSYKDSTVYPKRDPACCSQYPGTKDTRGSGGGFGGSGKDAGGYAPGTREGLGAPPGSRGDQRYVSQGEQQRLLSYRNSPTSCCAKHGSFSDGGVGAGGGGGGGGGGGSQADYPLKRQRSTRSNRSNASRRRQNEDACTTCLRGTLHCYNVCILVIGCAALGVGVWLLVTDFGARNVTPIVGNDLYEVTTYLLIAGGGAVALLAFCGCCGTIREDKCVLSFYGTTLAVVLIVLGIACGIAFFFRGAISVSIQTRMKNSLTMYYGINTRTDLENRRITESWDAMQRQLQCCGITGNTTSKYSWSFYSTATIWKREEDKKSDRRRVPESCCAKGNVQLCTGQKDFNGPPLFFDSHLHQYQEINPYLYTTGCYDKLVGYLKTYSTVVGCVAAVVPVFLIFGIAVSFCLCARVAGIASDEEVEL